MRIFKSFFFNKKLARINENSSLLTDFSKIYEEESSKLPFRTNLLDSFNVNENAHSRLLISLLKYKPALCHFLKFLEEKKKLIFDISLIVKPILTAEKWRIDGLIQEEGKYAFIIENKIHNAAEQSEQIGRYIDACKQLGYKLKQIYILYLTRYAENNPTVQTWGNYKESDFASRYIKIAYKEDIVVWLEEYLKEISERETIVKSAVIQYIDYLKHVFNNREIFKEMDNKLQDFLVEKLQLTDKNNVKKIDIITTKISEIDELQKHLKALIEVTKEKCFKDWEIQLKNNFTARDIKTKVEKGYHNVYLELKYEGTPFIVAIEYEFSEGIYYGIARHFSSQTLNDEIKCFFSDFLKDREFKSNDWWYGWKDTTFQDAYTEFSVFLKDVLDKLETQNN
ncbi:PD-(D/E)XK nuclease family protein [Capnocytophaga leadbetteri]